MELDHLGGSCVNRGCTPGKAMIASSRLAAQTRRASERGVRIPTVEVASAAVMDRARGGWWRAREIGRARGFIKVVAEAGSRRILGAAALRDSGSEAVQLFVELMNAGATADTMLDEPHIHPTLDETAKNAVAALPE